MLFETAIGWSCLALGMNLAMTLVFDRDRLLRWTLARSVFFSVYVVLCLCVR